MSMQAGEPVPPPSEQPASILPEQAASPLPEQPAQSASEQHISPAPEKSASGSAVLWTALGTAAIGAVCVGAVAYSAHTSGQGYEQALNNARTQITRLDSEAKSARAERDRANAEL